MQGKKPNLMDADHGSRTTPGALAVLLLLTAVGAFFRFWRLGELGFIVDEGYQAAAVAGILEHGVPLLDSGFIYSRSILFLYLQAGSALLLGFDEFALRLPTAILGVLGIPVAYWFGKSLFSVRVGLVLAALMALSAWEIEYSRYARFYTLFQLLYMVGLVAWYRGFIEMKTAWRLVFVGVFLLILTVHHLAVMIGLCFLVIIPLRGYTLPRKAAYFGLAGACGVLWKLWDKVEARVQFNLGRTEPWGAATAETALPSGPLGLPGMKLPDWHFVAIIWDQHRAWLIGGAVVAALVSAAVAHFAYHGRTKPGPDVERTACFPPEESAASRLLRALLLIGVLGAAVLNLVALAMVLAVAYLAFFVRRWRQLVRPEVLLTVAVSAAATFTWTGWYKLGDHPDASLTAGLAAMLDFPGLYDYWFKWMVYGWPAMLGLLVIAFVVMCRRAVMPDDRCSPAWFVMGATLIPMVVTAQLAWKFSESRYFFHLYPMMLLGLAVATAALADAAVRKFGEAGSPRATAVVTAVFALALLFAAQDTNGAKAWDVASREYTSYRDPIRSVLNFPWHADFHQDLRSGSERAREQIGPDDVVVVVGPPHQAVTYGHYLGGVDYIATNFDPYLTLVQQDDGFWMDLKSGGRLVTRAAELETLRNDLRPGQRLWLFSDRRITQQGEQTWTIGDRQVTLGSCWYLSNAEKPLKELVRAWMAEGDPKFEGQDKITTVHVFGAPAAVSPAEPPAQ